MRLREYCRPLPPGVRLRQRDADGGYRRPGVPVLCALLEQHLCVARRLLVVRRKHRKEGADSAAL